MCSIAEIGIAETAPYDCVSQNVMFENSSLYMVFYNLYAKKDIRNAVYLHFEKYYISSGSWNMRDVAVLIVNTCQIISS
jgi:hypothetical protein